jgi:hypothetical protein
MLQDLTRAVLFDPNNPEYFRVRGYFNLQRNRWEEALADLTKAAQLRPNYYEAIRGRVIAEIELFRFNDAWQDAKGLRDLGMPLDDSLLEKLKQKSGQADYPQ